MPSIAELSVTVLPSEPVDTRSSYKNVLRLAPGGGRPTGEPTPRLPHRMVPAYPPFGCVWLHDYADPRVMPTSPGHSRRPECRDLAMPTALRICVQSVECQIDCCETRQIR